VIAIGSLAGNVSRSASSSRLSRWAAAAMLWVDAECFFRCLRRAALGSAGGSAARPRGARGDERERLTGLTWSAVVWPLPGRLCHSYKIGLESISKSYTVVVILSTLATRERCGDAFTAVDSISLTTFLRLFAPLKAGATLPQISPRR
jgi:hypothetical protein